MLRNSKVTLLAITLACVLCLTMIPRASANYGEINSFLRNPNSGISPANYNAAFIRVYENYVDRAISLFTCAPLVPWDPIFNGDEYLAMGHSYYMLPDEVDNFVEMKKYYKHDYRIEFYIDDDVYEGTVTPVVYNPLWDEDEDGVREGAYTFRVGTSFKPGEISEGYHVFNFIEYEYNHDTDEWVEIFNWNDYLSTFGLPNSYFIIEYY
ncbi:MAG: hypothetical protein ACFFCF_09615 [Promethearchaeota archaeon]